MKRVMVKGINWDCNQETAERNNLPENAELTTDDGKDVFDALSDEYGFCVNYVESIDEY